jgi:hypothetical protein
MFAHIPGCVLVIFAARAWAVRRCAEDAMATA